MVPHMVHLQDVVKLHTFVLGHLGALLLACFGFDLRFALVAFDLVSDPILCEGVGVRVGARGGSTWAGGDYLRGALSWERPAILRTTNKARSHTHTQAQATQPPHRGPPTPVPTANQQCRRPPRCASRYRFGDRSPLKRGSTDVSSRCSRRKARIASCTRARCGRLSAARARRRRRVAPRSLPVAEDEAEPSLLSVDSAPPAADDELDGLSSLSVDEGGPDDGNDGARRACRRRRWPLEGTAFMCRRSAPLRDLGRAGRAAGEAVNVKADAVRVAPPVRGRSLDVPDPGSGGASPPALTVTGEGRWAAARARATAEPRPGTGVPSDAAFDASSAASRNT